jgi:hypothetical protein
MVTRVTLSQLVMAPNRLVPMRGLCLSFGRFHRPRPLRAAAQHAAAPHDLDEVLAEATP